MCILWAQILTIQVFKKDGSSTSLRNRKSITTALVYAPTYRYKAAHSGVLGHDIDCEPEL